MAPGENAIDAPHDGHSRFETLPLIRPAVSVIVSGSRRSCGFSSSSVTERPRYTVGPGTLDDAEGAVASSE